MPNLRSHTFVLRVQNVQIVHFGNRDQSAFPHTSRQLMGRDFVYLAMAGASDLPFHYLYNWGIQSHHWGKRQSNFLLLLPIYMCRGSLNSCEQPIGSVWPILIIVTTIIQKAIFIFLLTFLLDILLSSVWLISILTTANHHNIVYMCLHHFSER